MKKISSWMVKNYLTVVVFLGVLLVIIWNLGSYPNYFDYCVEHAIHFQVNKVLDNADVSQDVSWKWRNMHQLEGGRSPIYGGIIEIGLRIFGLTLFGIKVFPAIIAFLVLILMYIVMRKFFSQFFSLTFIVLLATSPWYLVVTRSGSIVGLSLSMVLIALCLVTLMFLYKEGKKTVIIPILAGVSVAILPYGYAITRLVPLFLIFWLIINIKKINKLHFAIFLVSILAVLSLQVNTIKESAHIYFYARGESMFEAAKDENGSISIDYIENKLKENIVQQGKMLLGFNGTNNFWNPNIAESFWMPNIVIYPRFLVPFFVWGFLLYLIYFIRKRTILSSTPILYFFVTIAPGLMAGRGMPDMGRNYLAIAPLYFFIAYCINHYFELFKQSNINTDLSSDNALTKKAVSFIVISAIFISFITFTAGFQVVNFYGQDKGTCDEKHVSAHDMYKYLQEYFKQCPNGRILICDYYLLNEYSYVTIRWLGGRSFEDKLKSGQIKLLRDNNKDEIENLVKSGYFDKVLAPNNDDIGERIPALKGVGYEEFDLARVFNVKK